jgi:hypothetical protein
VSREREHAGRSRGQAAAVLAGRATSGVLAACLVALVALAPPSRSSAAPLQRTQPSALAARLSAGARHSAALTLAIASLYKVTVPPGTWVPLNVSVTNRGAADVEADLVVQAPAAQPGQSTPGCVSNGPSTFTCLGPQDYSANTAPREPLSPSPTAVVTYEARLSLAGGTSKQLTLYVLAGPPGQGVLARAQTGPGRVLAQARAQLPVAFGLTAPAVLVVTDNPPAVPVLTKLVAPTGAQPQLQYMAPSALPALAAALGAFRAVTIDQADTSTLSPAQGQALEGYVDAGGTLVVAGGLGWRGAVAGLPAGLLPGHPTGTVGAMALPGLASLMGTAPVPGPVPVDRIDVSGGAAETMTQGTAPLVLEQDRGSGHVVLLAFDPSAAPLATWAGAPALLSRLFAPAYRSGGYDTSLPYAEGGGVFPVAPSGAPPSVVASLGGNFDSGAALMSPGTAVNVLTGYLGQAPALARPPAVGFLALLLFGYIFVVGIVLVAVVSRARRRVLVWAVVPALAIAAVLTASVTGIGGGSSPVVQEVRVAQLPPGGHLAQVVSMGLVQLPHGGSRRIELSSLPTEVQQQADGLTLIGPGLVGNLAAGAGAHVSIGQGHAQGTTSITVSGPPRSRGGWSASGTVDLAGSVAARTVENGDLLSGTVHNDLGVRLLDAQVVVASGGASAQLGTLAPGRSTGFEVFLSPNDSPWAQGFGASAPVVADQPASGAAQAGQTGATATGPGGVSAGSGATVARGDAARTTAGGPARPADVAAAQREVETTLGDLAASYSTEHEGAPVFVAMAARKLFPVGPTGGGEGPVVTDVVVVPLTNGQDRHQPLTDVPGELVASTGVTGETESAITTGSLTLQAGGTFDYEFVLPGTRWRGLELDLGSSSGETFGPPLVGLRAYNYATGHWDALRVRPHAGELLAHVPDVAHHLGPGGTLEVQVVATQDGVEVYGGFPTVSATPAGSAQAKPVSPEVSAVPPVGHGRRPLRPAQVAPARTALAHMAPIP